MRRSGELERTVMDVLWEAGKPCTAKDVLEALPGQDLAYTTVITVLERLARKGTANRRRTGRSWQYTPAASRESYVSSLMRDILGQAGDPEAVLVHFARSVSPPEAAALREALKTEDSADDADDDDTRRP
ncbi:BlaI/MecI/CopY family transcriptional regulator [Streptomyces sp. PSKA54]|uniref:BlaI/MecI/CopY family transcriptional regulator n=1 Tax=Streptomyces himalayensis subsp. aureolus TaxID=2758039 RepID=A0A7W2D3W3_9ACTN|nr:BlaI/MecI/CopY family transcriptional regulator [Streptomyces himalayensis]MBA4864297.1 BlaI/MecI/CopY family transcriptional regulator [Streptomyces himalayensis subsp. aureolus]